MSPEDVALRLLGLSILTLPLFLVAVNSVLRGEENFSESHPEGELHYSMLILLSYVTLITSVVVSGYILTDVTSRVGDVALYMMQAFALLVGVAIITALKHEVESETYKAYFSRLLWVFWLLAGGLIAYSAVLTIGLVWS